MRMKLKLLTAPHTESPAAHLAKLNVGNLRTAVRGGGNSGGEGGRGGEGEGREKIHQREIRSFGSPASQESVLSAPYFQIFKYLFSFHLLGKAKRCFLGNTNMNQKFG